MMNDSGLGLRHVAIANARLLAERVEDLEQRRTLLAGLDTVLFMDVDHRIVDEARKLAAHWRSLGEYATASQCVRDLDNVLTGGSAPGAGAKGFRPKGR